MIAPVKIQVRFSDLDVLGHVNNNVYFSYFEMARVHYFRELLGSNWDWKKYGIVLAKNEIEYLRSVLITDSPEIILYTMEIGTKSFTLGYELMVSGILYAKGRSVQVCYNAESQSTIPVPEQMRAALQSIIRE